MKYSMSLFNFDITFAAVHLRGGKARGKEKKNMRLFLR